MSIKISDRVAVQKSVDKNKFWVHYVDNKKRVRNWEKRTGLLLPVGSSVPNSAVVYHRIKLLSIQSMSRKVSPKVMKMSR